MNTLAFDQFTKKIYIKAPVERLYAYWSTAAGITTWFLRKATYKDGNGVVRKPKSRVQAGIPIPGNGTTGRDKNMDFLEISFSNSKVAITLKKMDQATLLTLIQYGIPTDDESKLKIHYGCSRDIQK